ncbi:MAG: DNA polymerase I, partial [Lachnospiraceae bacterium]|nr:DNA polymerase I [Lachnospiraceae bacterium]
DYRNKNMDKDLFFDTSVAAYILDPLSNDYPMDQVLKDEKGMILPSQAELLKKQSMTDVITQYELTGNLLDEAFLFGCIQSYVPFEVEKEMTDKLEDTGMLELYKNIEIPLIFTLFDMEICGMTMERDALRAYGEELSKTEKEIEQRIYDATGEKFNINSPKQMGIILFEKMGLQGGKKTKSGYSTAADVLKKLAAENPVVSDIMTYRKYSKLMSTYVEGLGKAVSSDNKVHSTFQQKVTATGRISSTEPNLQNIPIRLELGRKIRKVFHPDEGYIYLDADYSQIELRVLAHMSGDKNLIEAYKEGKDIHRSTASLVFHTPFDEVTSLQRSRAKAVNFGIVYGISAFGLSEDLGISRGEAKDYIEGYYEAYPDLKKYLEGLVDEARNNGYAVTLLGRRRPLPELKSSNFMQRSFGERVAKNSPIQGTAADIIKIAMVRVHDRLKRENLESRLVLQVHDELLIETKNEELTKVSAILKEEMESAVTLSVPLEVDVETGETWYDAK